MGHYAGKVFIPKPIENVYRHARDVKALEIVLPSIDRITTLEMTPTRSLHRFDFKAAGRRISYLEDETWDDTAHTNSFFSPEGDFQKYRGRYVFTPVEGGTEFGFELEYELVIPLIGALLKSLIAKLMHENCQAILTGIERLCLEDIWSDEAVVRA